MKTSKVFTISLLNKQGKEGVDQRRQAALLYLALAALGMFILAAGLGDLHLQPGLPVPGAETVSPAGPAQQTGSPALSISLPWLLQGGLALGIILFLLALTTALLKKRGLKKVALLAAGLVILFVLFSQLPRMEGAQYESPPGSASVAQQPAFSYATAPIGNPPAGLNNWVVAGLLLIILGLITWLLIRAFRQPQNVDHLAQAAQAAVQALADGQSVTNVVIQCYLDMQNVVREEQGIEREEDVTPREFETYLVNRGIPKDPLFQLTRLFEKARYGDQALNQLDEQEATSCLFAIQSACQAGQQGAR